MAKYLYNPDMSLVDQFDFLRDNIRPEAYTDAAIAAAMEKLYDAIVPVMQGYRDTLAEDSPLAIYLNYFTRSPIEILDDENDEPELYATVPLGSVIEGKFTKIPALSTVRITAASLLGDVGITRNLSASRGFETRVFWDSLTDYRVTAEKAVAVGNWAEQVSATTKSDNPLLDLILAKTSEKEIKNEVE